MLKNQNEQEGSKKANDKAANVYRGVA